MFTLFDSDDSFTVDYEVLDSIVSDSRDTVSTICQEFSSLHNSLSGPFHQDEIPVSASPSSVFDWYSSLENSFSLPDVLSHLKSLSRGNAALLLDLIEEYSLSRTR